MLLLSPKACRLNFTYSLLAPAKSSAPDLCATAEESYNTVSVAMRCVTISMKRAGTMVSLADAYMAETH